MHDESKKPKVLICLRTFFVLFFKFLKNMQKNYSNLFVRILLYCKSETNFKYLSVLVLQSLTISDIFKSLINYSNSII